MTSSQTQRLRHLIKDSRIGYVELEEKTGIAKSSIQRYASGSTKKIPVDAVEKLASVLGVLPAYITGWTDIYGNQPSKHPEPQVEEVLEGILARLDRDSYDSEESYEVMKASLECTLQINKILTKNMP